MYFNKTTIPKREPTELPLDQYSKLKAKSGQIFVFKIVVQIYANVNHRSSF